MSAGGFGEQPDQGQFGQGQPGQFGQGQFGQQPGWPPPPPPYGHAGPYGPVGAGWPQPAGRRTNPLAIAALCCAIGQFIACLFAGIAAIVLGSISLQQIRQSGEEGRGLAMTGLVLGIVGTIMAVVLILVVLAAFHSASTDFNNLNNPGN